MKIKAKLFIFILLTKSIRDGAASFKCDTGYKMTKGGMEMSSDFYEAECEGVKNRCYSAKGSFVMDGVTCEFFQTIFNLKVRFKCFSDVL